MLSDGQDIPRTVLRVIQECMILLHVLPDIDLKLYRFNYNIPPTTKVPHWAYLDVVVRTNRNFAYVSLKPEQPGNGFSPSAAQLAVSTLLLNSLVIISNANGRWRR
jgi:hypothetical protein